MLRYTKSFSVANYELGKVEITGAMNSFTMTDTIHAYHVYQRTWMHLLGKATGTIARKSSNEHDPYAVAVLENVGGGAAGSSGCPTRLCTLKPKVSFCSGWPIPLERGWGRGC